MERREQTGLDTEGALMADGFVRTVYKHDQWLNEVEGAVAAGRVRGAAG
jgi:hypothetical protein